jgi:hypothetical protein
LISGLCAISSSPKNKKLLGKSMFHLMMEVPAMLQKYRVVFGTLDKLQSQKSQCMFEMNEI